MKIDLERVDTINVLKGYLALIDTGNQPSLKLDNDISVKQRITEHISFISFNIEVLKWDFYSFTGGSARRTLSVASNDSGHVSGNEVDGRSPIRRRTFDKERFVSDTCIDVENKS